MKTVSTPIALVLLTAMAMPGMVGATEPRLPVFAQEVVGEQAFAGPDPTALEIAVGGTLEAIDMKRDAVHQVEVSIANERAAIRALRELLESGEYGDLERSDIVTAFKQVRAALKEEKRALRQLRRSLRRLHVAVRALGWDPPVVSMPVAHWRFDEGAGLTAHDSVGTNHATLINGPTWSYGQRDGALSFDGVDDAVAIPDAAVFDFGASSFSMAAWFRTTDTSSRPAPFIVNFRQDDNDPHIEIYVIAESGRVGTHILPGNQRIEFGCTVNDGRWHHVAITMDNGAVDGYRLYLDGVERGHRTASLVLSDWDTLTIGHISPSLHYKAFKGDIDDVAVWDVALSEAEVVLLYESGPDGGGARNGEGGDCALRPHWLPTMVTLAR